eukprot:1192791-Prymnesium_polylepis.1
MAWVVAKTAPPPSPHGLTAQHRPLAAAMPPPPPPEEDPCEAALVRSRTKTWATGFEVYFRIPEWTPGTLVTADLGRRVAAVKDCWHVEERSATLDSSGRLSFRLGGVPRDKDKAVGCVLDGQIDTTLDVHVEYHGTRCFATPPPPPHLLSLIHI